MTSACTFFRARNQCTCSGGGSRSHVRATAHTVTLPACGAPGLAGAIGTVVRPWEKRSVCGAPMPRTSTSRTGWSNEIVTGAPPRTSSQRPRSLASGVNTVNVRCSVCPTSQPAHRGRRTVSSTVSGSPAGTGVAGRILPLTRRAGTTCPAGLRTTMWETCPAYQGWLAPASASESSCRRGLGHASRAAATAPPQTSSTSPAAHTSGRRRQRQRGRRPEGAIATLSC